MEELPPKGEETSHGKLAYSIGNPWFFQTAVDELFEEGKLKRVKYSSAWYYSRGW